MSLPSPLSPSCEVLVVEDDDCLRDTLQEILQLEGFGVQVAGHGQEALALLDRQPGLPQLILLDLMMPVMNGWEFLDVLKQAPGSVRAAIPVIVVSAALPLADEAHRLHGCRVLKKPLEIEQLIDIVRAHCQVAN